MANQVRRYIPIEALTSIDESNYLTVDFRHILTSKGIAGYEDTINQLWETGRVLENVLKDGLADRIAPNQQYYLEALRWLKGQAQTTSWIAIAVPDLNNQANARPQLDQFSQTWMQNYLNEFFNRPILTTYFYLDRKLESRELTKNQIELLSQKEAELISDLDKEATRLIGDIKAAKSLENWQTYYDDLIKDPYAKDETQ